MKTVETLSRSDIELSFEIMPPRHGKAVPNFWETIEDLVHVHPDFLSVTYGAGGKDRTCARVLVEYLHANTSVQPLAHLTCVAMPSADVRRVIDGYLDSGVRTFLALRGDPPQSSDDGIDEDKCISSAAQLVRFIRSIEEERCAAHPGYALRGALEPLSIGVAAFPAGNPMAGTTPQQEAERLLVKQVAGASFAITQLFWDVDDYFSFVSLARSIGVEIPILGGLLPPTDPKRLRKVGELTGILPPQEFISALDASDNPETRLDLGVQAGARLAQSLLEGGAPGLHLFTFNRARPALDIVRRLGLAQSAHAHPAHATDSTSKGLTNANF